MKWFWLLLISSRAAAQITSMTWYHEPASWSVKNNHLEMTTEPHTDYWRKTHYGYVTDNGHFYYREETGAFEVTVKITGAYKELYDQAGLMIRIDSTQWIKSGVEFVNGKLNISAVYTREYSDWSVITLDKPSQTVWLKMKREKDAVELSYSLNGKDYFLQRLGYLSPDVKVQVGMMAAAPEGKGFTVGFDNFEIRRF